MLPERRGGGQGWRAALAVLAFAVTALIIHALFSSGFGRVPRPAGGTPEPVAAPTPPGNEPGAAGAARLAVSPATLAVVSDDFWLTYLPRGLARCGGGLIEPEPGVEGGRARFGAADRFVEAQVEHGAVAADWRSYRARATVLDARDTTVRGKPAVVGGHPDGGRVIVWLERAGTGAWVRVSESLREELIAVAVSVKAPVGD
ncbi:hypothetical protein [Nonomuraea sp. NPDC049480]|uniref:hypothetical protein n=1 Tax=Nonomuraea sp. NPDC049480 TaxID=3364353 RepID=UPI00379C6C08